MKSNLFIDTNNIQSEPYLGGNIQTDTPSNITKNTHTTTPIIKKKTKKVKFLLGKRGDKVSILIKNNKTRKNVENAINILKKKKPSEIKKFLKKKNVIKSGTNAPNDVLKEMYENCILSGDLNFKSTDNLIHNYISN